jgi:hypothetical protein
VAMSGDSAIKQRELQRLREAVFGRVSFATVTAWCPAIAKASKSAQRCLERRRTLSRVIFPRKERTLSAELGTEPLSPRR